MFSLLCGSVPFYGDDELEIVKSIQRGELYFEDPIWKSVSSSAKDLITKLLTKNPVRRLSASGALEHPWLRVSLTSVLGFHELEFEIIERLLSFRRPLKLREIFLNGFVNALTEREIAPLRQAFIKTILVISQCLS